MKTNQETFKKHLKKKTEELINKSIERGEYRPISKKENFTFED